MSKLNPREYFATKYPFRSDGADFLKLTLQELCIKGVIDLERKFIQLNKRERRKFPRFFFSRGRKFSAYQAEGKAEAFVLDLLSENNEFRFYELRHHIRDRFGRDGLDGFKNELVLADLKSKGFRVMKWFPSSEANRAAKEISRDLKFLEASIKQDGPKPDNGILAAIERLGSCILLLSTEAIRALCDVSDDVLEIRDLYFLERIREEFTALDAFIHVDFVQLDSFDVGGFDGFGGGDFGGGGAGFDW